MSVCLSACVWVFVAKDLANRLNDYMILLYSEASHWSGEGLQLLYIHLEKSILQTK